MFKVFPATLIEGQKVPLIRGWQTLASNDPNQIKLWQELFRDRISFWGVPCGKENGILVLDSDVKSDGPKTIQEMGLVIPDTLSQKTMNGGRHYIFKYDPAKSPGNKVGFLPGLDIRSQGGWIAWYGTEADFSKPIMEAPDWLTKLALHRPTETPKVFESLIKLDPAIAQVIFQSSIDAVMNAPPGESNDTLNRESYKVGQLVASGSVSREFAQNELFRAAKARGKPDYEAQATITSGINGGLKHPLTSPFGSEAPKPVIDIPAPPEAPQRWTPFYLTRHDLLNTAKLKKPQLFRGWSTEDIQLLTADGGTGKSTLKLNEAICLALGDRFLGFENMQQGKTLFITGEDSSEKLAAMLGAIMHQMGLFDGTAENERKIETILNSIVIKKDADLCLIMQDKQGFLHPNRDAMNKLLQAVDDIKPKMIIFDPIASFWGSESKLNDMNKAVTKFMSELVEKGRCCVEMINHSGKASSATKDMTQFAGRGGSGLPSNSRVCKTLRSLTVEEFRDMTGTELVGDQTAMVCNVSKFSDGSNLLNKPFVIIRNGYLFSRVALSAMKAKEMEKELSDNERIFTFVKEQRAKNKYPTQSIVTGHFMNSGDPISKAATDRAVKSLIYEGHLGEKLKLIENPDLTNRERALVLCDMNEKEL